MESTNTTRVLLITLEKWLLVRHLLLIPVQLVDVSFLADPNGRPVAIALDTVSTKAVPKGN